MLSENILNFSLSGKSIEGLFKRIHAEKGRILIAVSINNFLPISYILEEKEFQNLMKELENNISKFLKLNNKNSQKSQIEFIAPFFFVSIDNSEDIRSKLYELDNILSIRNYSKEDFQTTISWALIDKPQDQIFRQIVTSLKMAGNQSGIVEYDPEVINKLHEEYLLLSKLKSSLRAKLARFAYQPIIKCSSGEAAYHECLMRIPDDNGELISAGQSILLSEKYGLINYVDRCVIELAAKELKANKDLMLAINISNMGLLDLRLEKFIEENLKERKIASRLIIEITETSINNNFERISAFISFVKNLGCKIAIDDFGSGATSISHLKNLKFDILKIDGSLTRNVLDSDYNMYLVKTIIQLAKEVRAKTVAEFVENGRIAKFLMDSGIDYMQGNFFSPAQNFRTWSNK